MYLPRFRLPLHSTRFAFSSSFTRSQLSTPFRRLSTETPKQKSKAPYAFLGIAAVGGIAYYYYYSPLGTTAAVSAKVKAAFKPTKDDYQKVCSHHHLP